MHDPISLGALGSLAHIEDEGFLDPNLPPLGGDHFIGSGGLPIPRPGHPIGSGPVWILSVSRAKEVPFFLSKQSFV